MASTTDATTLETLSLLEARLLRIEHLLYGANASSTEPTSHREPAITTLENLERRFAALVGRMRPYGELMTLYRAHPTLFDPPRADEPATDLLPPEAARATVLAAASSFPATAGALTAVADCPVPDARACAGLVALAPRMRGLEATRLAQASEIAVLRARSERVVRSWYEQGVLERGRVVAGLEERATGVERAVRRLERGREREAEEVY